MAKQKAEYKIIIQGPEGREVIEADAFVLATHTQNSNRRVVNLNSNVKACFPSNDTDQQAATRLYALAEQLDKDVDALAAQLIGEDAEAADVEDSNATSDELGEGEHDETVITDETGDQE